MLAFLVGLAAPSIAFAMGVRPENIENRPLASAPAITPWGIGDSATYAALDLHLADNFPFKNQLVWTNAAARYYALGVSTNPDVMVGEQGWLFSRESAQAACRYTAAEVLAQLDRAGMTLADAGVALHFVIAPDKEAIYPERRPREASPCTDDQRPAMIAGSDARPSVLIELWTAMRAARAADPATLLFWPRDTHWSPAGALAALRQVVTRIEPAAWDENAVGVAGTLQRVGDLSRLMGVPTTDELPAVQFDPSRTVTRTRPSTSVETVPGREVDQYVVSGGAPAIPGRTLIIYDSAFGIYGPMVAAWFQESTWLHVNELVAHPELLDELPPFDRVVLERVERVAYLADYEAILAPVIARANEELP
jgi:alginate O-acetyltransferase complex protein AlgJ